MDINSKLNNYFTTNRVSRKYGDNYHTNSKNPIKIYIGGKSKKYRCKHGRWCRIHRYKYG